MPEFSWQGFNQMEGGKPTNNSLRHSTNLIHPQTPSLLALEEAGILWKKKKKKHHRV